MESLPQTLESDPLLEMNRNASAPTSLVALQRAAVEKALAESNGHRARAAESLGISIRTLQRKLKAWGLDGHDSNRKPHAWQPPREAVLESR
jgi:DNA-binding NtrC family response regulator